MAAPVYTEPTPNIKTLKDISVLVDNDLSTPTEFRKVIQAFRLDPQQAAVTTTGGTPDAVFVDMGPVTWTLTLKILQDSISTDAFTNWFLRNQGTVHEMLFYPYKGDGWRVQVRVPAAPIGGDMNTWIADSITCQVVGKPSRAIAANPGA